MTEVVAYCASSSIIKAHTIYTKNNSTTPSIESSLQNINHIKTISCVYHNVSMTQLDTSRYHTIHITHVSMTYHVYHMHIVTYLAYITHVSHCIITYHNISDHITRSEPQHRYHIYHIVSLYITLYQRRGITTYDIV